MHHKKENKKGELIPLPSAIRRRIITRLLSRMVIPLTKPHPWWPPPRLTSPSMLHTIIIPMPFSNRIPPIRQLHVPRILAHCSRTPHRPISTETSLPPPHNNIQPYRGNITHDTEHGEREKSFIGAADGDTR